MIEQLSLSLTCIRRPSVSATGLFLCLNGEKKTMAKQRKQKFVEKREQTPIPFHIQPLNPMQDSLLNHIHNQDLIVAMGPAGTGKTYCSVMKAAQLFLKGEYTKIVLTRANISTGRSLGFFPGTLEEKMTPWLMPMISVLEEAFGKSYYELLSKRGSIEIQPLETIRGRSFDSSIILVDECQQLTFDEVKAITTRIGRDSKLVLMGDVAQSDLSGRPGIMPFVKMCEKHNIPAPVIEFGIGDIVRSDIVGDLVKMFTLEGV